MLGLGAAIQARRVARSRATLWTVCWSAGSAIVGVGTFAAVGQLPERLASPVPLISLAGIVFILAMLGASMERHLRGIAAQADELKGVQEEIIGINAGLQEELAAEKRRVALLLHGPVQGRLAAVAMLLKLDAGTAGAGGVAADTRERSQAILDQVVADLMAVVDGKFTDDRALPDRLAQLVERWHGLAEVSLTSDRRAFDAVANDPALGIWLFEIVEEGINNAVTHGCATHIDIHITLEDDVIEVSVSDDGVGLRTEGEPGLGLSTIGRSPARLTLRPLSRGGCQLLVTVPLSEKTRRQ